MNPLLTDPVRLARYRMVLAQGHAHCAEISKRMAAGEFYGRLHLSMIAINQCPEGKENE